MFSLGASCLPRTIRLKLTEQHLLCVIANASVDLQDVVTNEPHEVGKVRHRRLVDDELEHGLLLDAVDVQGQGAHGDPHHALAVVEKLDGLRVQREVVRVLRKK